MKYANVNGEKVEAQTSGQKGTCRCCGSGVIAHCGPKYVNHWKHTGKRNCDPWKENETEWHRAWKAHFPKEWQEVVRFDGKGEKHVADVKTDKDLVIEFQRSPIKPEERQAREAFHKTMIWIVDGTRRVKDKDKFYAGVNYAQPVDGRDDLRVSAGSGPLITDWGGRNVVVFFDFGEEALWGRLPIRDSGIEYGFKVDKKTLIDSLKSSSESTETFDRLLFNYIGKIEAYEWHLKREAERSNNFLFGRQPIRTGFSSRKR